MLRYGVPAMAQHPTDGERRFWEENGYLFLEGAMAGGELTRLQQAFDRCVREEKAQWLEGIAQGTRPAGYFDIPDPFEKDDAFIDLIDHPSWYPCLMDFADDELLLLAPQVRTLPAQPVSYLRWHADVPHSYPLHMKVQIYVDDVPADGGAFGFVPGSHKPDAGECPNARPLDTMPGHRIFAGKAGDAVLFNSYGWHTSMVNRTGQARKSIILIYEKWSEKHANRDDYKSIADRCTTSARRKLLSLEPMRSAATG